MLSESTPRQGHTTTTTINGLTLEPSTSGYGSCTDLEQVITKYKSLISVKYTEGHGCPSPAGSRIPAWITNIIQYLIQAHWETSSSPHLVGAISAILGRITLLLARIKAQCADLHDDDYR